MGRVETSLGRPPAAFRKDARAKKARATLNQLIPSLLSAHPRARRGIEAAELISDPPRRVSPDNVSAPRVVLQAADTLTAARSLRDEALADYKEISLAILNMASPLSPGGGFLNGAGSQEESLCMRTTLLPSLRDEYYRLPELAAVYTPDVLVFRDEQEDQVLPKRDRWHVNCITAAMLRSPETERDALERGRYVHERDRELVLQKMRMVLRIGQMKGDRVLVLGAWGCGAYGNPVGEIAAAWRRVLLPTPDARGKAKAQRETWAGIDKIVFAIKDPGMAQAFAAAFGQGLEHEEGPEPTEGEGAADVANHKRLDLKELQDRISELEARIEAAPSALLRSGLASIRQSLQAQVQEVEAGDTSSEESYSSSGGRARRHEVQQQPGATKT
ncbi:uncharacterized protein E0L32_003776 [Thyridium curvatum]|uniref:Microbial-type PARG catalytic domain-containing protein n=1 Tax=Thyridium curvatum TaxID=1093900 RepID=A0A507B2H7_9PEZI|nr:uncharacterized protein E0L32_003776 [Thyridium curvatum]TPX16482.1 hypothetical protein E0L32_003776 [Thyridium curvatum]